MKGAILQVLPIFKEMLAAFEDARERYQLSSQYKLPLNLHSHK